MSSSSYDHQNPNHLPVYRDGHSRPFGSWSAAKLTHFDCSTLRPYEYLFLANNCPPMMKWGYVKASELLEIPKAMLLDNGDSRNHNLCDCSTDRVLQVASFAATMFCMRSYFLRAWPESYVQPSDWQPYDAESDEFLWLDGRGEATELDGVATDRYGPCLLISSSDAPEECAIICLVNYPFNSEMYID